VVNTRVKASTASDHDRDSKSNGTRLPTATNAAHPTAATA